MLHARIIAGNVLWNLNGEIHDFRISLLQRNYHAFIDSLSHPPYPLLYLLYIFGVGFLVDIVSDIYNKLY